MGTNTRTAHGNGETRNVVLILPEGWNRKLPSICGLNDLPTLWFLLRKYCNLKLMTFLLSKERIDAQLRADHLPATSWRGVWRAKKRVPKPPHPPFRCSCKWQETDIFGFLIDFESLFDEGSYAKETSCFVLSILYAVCGGVSEIKLQGSHLDSTSMKLFVTLIMAGMCCIRESGTWILSSLRHGESWYRGSGQMRSPVVR